MLNHQLKYKHSYLVHVSTHAATVSILVAGRFPRCLHTLWLSLSHPLSKRKLAQCSQRLPWARLLIWLLFSFQGSFHSLCTKQSARRNVRDRQNNLIDCPLCVKQFVSPAQLLFGLSGPRKIKCFQFIVNTFFLRASRFVQPVSEAGNIKNRSAFVNLFLCSPSSFFHDPPKLRDSKSTSDEPCRKDRGKLSETGSKVNKKSYSVAK